MRFPIREVSLKKLGDLFAEGFRFSWEMRHVLLVPVAL